MNIRKYRPAFFEGFEEESYEISNRDELMQCPLITSAQEHGEVCISMNDDGCATLMVVIENRDEPQGCEWWVISIIDNEQDASIISQWLPDWESVIAKYNSFNPWSKTKQLKP